ncbi:MAG: hypothetical protein RJA24_1622 [Pseudomonadota bacterium]|jgi:hypothetical protein
MNALLRTGLAILFLGILTSCATPSTIVPNTTTADELLKKLGSPTDKRANPAGGEFWEYATGPEGTQTWLFWIDSGRMVRSSTQLLTEERLRQIVPGKTTEAEVRALLGTPRDTTRFSNETAWEWRIMIGPTPGIYVVRFDAKGLTTGFNVLPDMLIDSNPDSGP